jgi:hypothetical protein
LIIAIDIGNAQIQILLLDETMSFFSEALGIQGSSINDNLDAFLIDNLQCLFETIKGRGSPTRMAESLSIDSEIGQIDLFTKGVSDTTSRVSIDGVLPAK